MRIGSVLLGIWLLVGALAAYQRGYFVGDDPNCARVSAIAVTIVAGPLNYAGVNPEIDGCLAPEPSR